jgi:uncharacterized protein (TIGR02217 family)
MVAFHEERFPTDISRGGAGGPERRTEIVVLGSGREERNARWADSRRRYDAGLGIRKLDEIHDVIRFFEERRGRLHGFRWKDHADFRSCAPGRVPTATDQFQARGDGVTREFPLIKTYGTDNAWVRRIAKPVAGTLRAAVNGVSVAAELNAVAGTMRLAQAPANGAVITAGYEFDVPVRFDTDRLEISLAAFEAGQIPHIPLVEIRL